MRVPAFVIALAVSTVSLAQTAPATESGDPAARQPQPVQLQQQGPSVLVLPFSAPGSGEHAWVGQGVRQNLTADLAEFSRARIVAPADAQPAADAEQAVRAGRDAGATYVVFGHAQSANGDIRITGQVIEVSTGRAVGALKATAPAAKVFDLQDAVASQAVAALPAGMRSNAVMAPAENSEQPPEQAAAEESGPTVKTFRYRPPVGQYAAPQQSTYMAPTAAAQTVAPQAPTYAPATYVPTYTSSYATVYPTVAYAPAYYSSSAYYYPAYYPSVGVVGCYPSYRYTPYGGFCSPFSSFGASFYFSSGYRSHSSFHGGAHWGNGRGHDGGRSWDNGGHWAGGIRGGSGHWDGRGNWGSNVSVVRGFSGGSTFGGRSLHTVPAPRTIGGGAFVGRGGVSSVPFARTSITRPSNSFGGATFRGPTGGGFSRGHAIGGGGGFSRGASVGSSLGGGRGFSGGRSMGGGFSGGRGR